MYAPTRVPGTRSPVVPSPVTSVRKISPAPDCCGSALNGSISVLAPAEKKCPIRPIWGPYFNSSDPPKLWRIAAVEVRSPDRAYRALLLGRRDHADAAVERRPAAIRCGRDLPHRCHGRWHNRRSGTGNTRGCVHALRTTQGPGRVDQQLQHNAGGHADAGGSGTGECGSVHAVAADRTRSNEAVSAPRSSEWADSQSSLP